MEVKMLFEVLFRREIKRISLEGLKKIMIVLYWENYRSSRPDNLFLCFTNGLILEYTKNANGLFYVKNIPNLISLPSIAKQQEQSFDATEWAAKFIEKHKFHQSQLLQNTHFQNLLLNCKDISQYFIVDSKSIKIPINLISVRFSKEKGNEYLEEFFEYCNIPLNSGSEIDAWAYIRSVIKRSMYFYQYTPKNPVHLARRIFDFEKTVGKKWQYISIYKAFKKIFPRVKFEVVQTDSGSAEPNQVLIKIKETKHHSFNIQDTASGYFETLDLFSEVISMKDTVLLIDEPALHLHPIKIRLLSKVLSTMAKRQIIIITHSPFFVTPKLFENNQSLIYIRRYKNDRLSNIINKPINFTLTLKPHIFNSEIFFSKLCLFVEGPGDEYAIRAINESLNNMLEENDILLVNAGSKNNIEPYISVIENYDIPHIIMVDKDYSKKQTSDTIMLSQDLEHVMRNIGWISKSNKITPCEAYQVVANAMKIHRSKVKSSELGIVFDKALSKVGARASSQW